MTIRPFLVALLLPLAFTATTLALVAWNRSGGRGPILLTEREVYPAPRSDDNTVATLWLNWQSTALLRPVPRSPATRNPEPVDRELRRGFAVMALREPETQRPLPPVVAPGAAQGGPAIDSRIAVAPPSRLVVIDADSDAATLHRRYPDGRTHIITAATIAVPPGRPLAEGWVTSIEPQRIHVPRELALPRMGGGFELEVWYGLRYEPWISAIRRR